MAWKCMVQNGKYGMVYYTCAWVYPLINVRYKATSGFQTARGHTELLKEPLRVLMNIVPPTLFSCPIFSEILTVFSLETQNEALCEARKVGLFMGRGASPTSNCSAALLMFGGNCLILYTRVCN
jgi:hypothetical protein